MIFVKDESIFVNNLNEYFFFLNFGLKVPLKMTPGTWNGYTITLSQLESRKPK